MEPEEEHSGSGSGSGGGSDSEPEEVEKKALPERTTRGKRFSSLVGEAAEADKQFWEQDAFQELDDDSEFSSKSGVKQNMVLATNNA